MGMILEFYAIRLGPDDTEAASIVRNCAQVASISINSRAVGDVLATFVPSLLAPLVGDAVMVERVAKIPSTDFGAFITLAASLRARQPPDEALHEISEAIDEAVAEALWRKLDLIVIAH